MPVMPQPLQRRHEPFIEQDLASEADSLSSISTDQDLADEGDFMSLDGGDSVTSDDFEWDTVPCKGIPNTLYPELQNELGSLSPAYRRSGVAVPDQDVPWLDDIGDTDVPLFTGPKTFVLTGPGQKWIEVSFPPDTVSSTESPFDAPLVTLLVANDAAARKRWRVLSTRNCTGSADASKVEWSSRPGLPSCPEDSDKVRYPVLAPIPLSRAFKRVHIDVGLSPEMPLGLVLPAVLEQLKFGLMLDELSIHLRPCGESGSRTLAKTVAAELNAWDREDIECENKVLITHGFAGGVMEEAVECSMSNTHLQSFMDRMLISYRGRVVPTGKT